MAVLPAAVQLLAVGAATKWLLLLVQWPLLIVLVMPPSPPPETNSMRARAGV